MADASGRFALPWLQPGQAQKEMMHNEALAILDAALHPVVQAVGISTPPGTPAIGQGWIVGVGAGGAWAGRAHDIAVWTEGGWRFVTPVIGMRAWSVADMLDARWDGSAWSIGTVDAATLRINGMQICGPRAAAAAPPSGGSVIDVQARAAIATLIARLSGHGLIAA